ncbi:MAG: phosphomannomutase/phosphoglucomutase [Lachnospiraceae bacterium]|nr:phosphomannomutase/phosphoglucomutase [Lachnospiraceae bacterium]MBP1584995.1 phosphomannomutase/phosphoglucomutase [Lachnospiraceae bacterium]
MSYSELQNGSDIRGIALENETGEKVNLTEKSAQDIAGAFVRWLSAKTGKKEVRIAIGRDSRLSGEALLSASVRGVFSEGGKAYDLGIASTPAMFMTTVLGEAPYDGSIMITASHLPWYRNGMKFFISRGGLEKNEIKELTKIADDIAVEDKDVTGCPAAEKVSFMDTYTGYLRDKIIAGSGKGDKPLAGLHIVVDAGNGAGGFFVSDVLEKLGADTTGSQFLEPDGHFPNHIPNPENKEAAESIKNATLASNADLGIIFDTDVDRAGAVLPGGKTLTRNDLIAALSVIALNSDPGTTIVTDSVTSDGLAAFIKAKGGVHKRFKRGYRNVIDEAIRLNESGIDSQLAIETSGHGAFKENYFLDDGAYLMVKLLIEMGKGNSLASLIEGLKEPAESAELRFHVGEVDDLQANGDRILKNLQDSAEKVPGWSLEKENYEGVRVNCDADHGNGWLLLRKSLHEPIMPLNIESDSEGGTRMIAEALYGLIADERTLDLTPIRDFIS